MILRVDPSSALPPYDQIRGQLATMIATGVLPAGQRLPTIRQLATDLALRLMGLFVDDHSYRVDERTGGLRVRLTKYKAS